MTVSERIAELQTEIGDLRSLIGRERDADVRNLASKLIALMVERVTELRKQL